MISRVKKTVAVILLASLTSCGGGDSTNPAQTPTALQLVSGNNQSADVDALLPNGFVVKVVDAAGDGVPNIAVQWSVTSGDGHVSSPTTTTDPSGLTAVTLTLGSTPGHVTVSATVAQLTPVVFTATAWGPPQQLAYYTQPTNVTAGAPIFPAVQILVQDAAGTTLPYSHGLATVVITPGTGAPGATMSGITTQVVTGGHVTFDNLRIDKVGTGYTLTATSDLTASASVVSTAFNVNLGQPAKLGFVVQPTDLSAGAVIAPAVQVVIQDAQGNTVTTATNSVTVTITAGTGGSGATLGGTLTHAAVSGVATFDDLAITKASSGYTLTATASSLTDAISTVFVVNPGPPKALVLTVQPTPTTPGAAISPAVQVAVRDSFANTVTSSTTGISVALTSGTGTSGAVLSGTLTRAASSGVASFDDLAIDLTGNGYTLTANASTLPPIESNQFAVVDSVGEVAAGNDHSCAAAPVAVWCFGANDHGQLGIGAIDAAAHASPLLLPATQLARLTAGGFSSCGLATSGAAYCWGDNGSGQLGDSSLVNRPAPVPVKGGLTFASITTGGAHTCGLTASGAAYCWGENFAGELGDSTSTPRSTPVPVAGGLTFVALSAGAGNFTCGITTTNDAYCWGYNSQGELGIGYTDASPHAVPTPVSGGLKFKAISSGSGHVCAIALSDVLYCWGGNVGGQLGNGGFQPSLTPAPVAGLASVTAVVARLAHTCALVGNGDAYCWGGGSVNFWNRGQLGNGDTADRLAPTPVLGGLRFVTLTAGDMHTCGVTQRGLAYCWGYNLWGQLGNQMTTDAHSPSLVLIQ